jgi:anti-sigma B factor antagonist
VPVLHPRVRLRRRGPPRSLHGRERQASYNEAVMAPRVRSIGIVNVLDLEGRITLGSNEIREMTDTIQDLLHAGRRRILLNLAGVTHIDSAGIGVLVALFKRAADGGGVIKLLSPEQRIADLLATTKLDSLFEVYREENVAIASY